MLRRGILSQRIQQSNVVATATRSYTDYTHHKYPNLVVVSHGTVGALLLMWIFGLSAGSMWWSSNRELKSDILRSWRRTLGTGYKWSDEWGPVIETIYTGLPDRAE